jgi:hypothetical protein
MQAKLAEEQERARVLQEKWAASEKEKEQAKRLLQEREEMMALVTPKADGRDSAGSPPKSSRSGEAVTDDRLRRKLRDSDKEIRELREQLALAGQNAGIEWHRKAAESQRHVKELQAKLEALAKKAAQTDEELQAEREISERMRNDARPEGQGGALSTTPNRQLDGYSSSSILSAELRQISASMEGLQRVRKQELSDAKDVYSQSEARIEVLTTELLHEQLKLSQSLRPTEAILWQQVREFTPPRVHKRIRRSMLYCACSIRTAPLRQVETLLNILQREHTEQGRWRHENEMRLEQKQTALHACQQVPVRACLHGWVGARLHVCLCARTVLSSCACVSLCLSLCVGVCVCVPRARARARARGKERLCVLALHAGVAQDRVGTDSQ